MAHKIRVGVLISGGGTNLQSIIDASESNRIDAKIVFVASDTARPVLFRLMGVFY